LRIRLKKSSVVIEILESSSYIDSVTSAFLNAKCRDKKEELLKNIYYICAKNVNYHNPQFFKKLIKSSHKHIELRVDRQEPLKQHYKLLKSNEKDSLHVIRKRYLKLAKTYHPDRVSYSDSSLVEEYTNRFQEIQRAYEVLKLKSAS
jgi:DnaJ-class molecular chaperone